MIQSIRILFFLLLVTITWLTLTSDPAVTSNGSAFMQWLSTLLLRTPEWGDKIGHFLGYGALGLTAAASRFTPPRKNWIPACLLTLYGVILEFVQIIGGTRSGELLDAVANMSGTLCGFAGYFLLTFAIEFIGNNTQAQR